MHAQPTPHESRTATLRQLVAACTPRFSLVPSDGQQRLLRTRTATLSRLTTREVLGAMSRIELPTQVSIHNLRSVLSKNQFFPEKPPEQFTLVFNPKFNHLEPFALTMLAAWASHWKKLGVPIVCENLTGRTAVYLRRMGLFNFLPVEADWVLHEHEEAGRFVTLQRVNQPKELAAFLTDLIPLLHMSDHAEHARAVRYCITEITQNVIEHSGGAAAFVCAQYYEKASMVAIGVADCGRGVREALSRNYDHKSDDEAIMAALKPGVTGSVRMGMYGSNDNAGAGLFFTRSIAKASQEYFAIVSGAAGYRLRRSQRTRQGSLFPVAISRDPTSDRHDLWTDLNRWRGTLVAINIGIRKDQQFDFANITKLIGDAFAAPNPGRSRAPKHEIKFT